MIPVVVLSDAEFCGDEQRAVDGETEEKGEWLSKAEVLRSELDRLTKEFQKWNGRLRFLPLLFFVLFIGVLFLATIIFSLHSYFSTHDVAVWLKIVTVPLVFMIPAYYLVRKALENKVRKLHIEFRKVSSEYTKHAPTEQKEENGVRP